MRWLRGANALGQQPLVIRTFDFGDDKTPWFLTAERNVVLNRGFRGLQFSLAERWLFETQLRAIAKASRGRDIRVLFPMVGGGDDLRRARELLASATREFDAVMRLIQRRSTKMACETSQGRVCYSKITRMKGP